MSRSGPRRVAQPERRALRLLPPRSDHPAPHLDRQRIGHHRYLRGLIHEEEAAAAPVDANPAGRAAGHVYRDDAARRRQLPQLSNLPSRYVSGAWSGATAPATSCAPGRLTAPRPGADHRPYGSWGDFTIVEIGPVSWPGGPLEAGAAGACQIRARSGVGRRQPTRGDEHDRTRIGPGQGRSARVAGLGGYQ